MTDNSKPDGTSNKTGSEADFDLDLGSPEADKSRWSRGDRDRAGANRDAADQDAVDGDTADRDAPDTSIETGGRGRARFAGVIALVLGLVGCLLSLGMLALSARALFSAGDLAERTLAPVEESIDRLETRIDQTDDLISSRGVADDEVALFQARADGLVDVASTASDGITDVAEHPIYRFLPIDDEEMTTTLAAYQNEAEMVREAVVGQASIDEAAAGPISDRLNTMQSSISSVGDMIDTTLDSLRQWVRLAALAGMVLALWSLWAQSTLARRGWRGLRGNWP